MMKIGYLVSFLSFFFLGRLSLDIQPTRFSSEFRNNNELS